MSHRRWAVIGAVTMVAALGAWAALSRTSSSAPPPRYTVVPQCRDVFSSPLLQDAVRTAFSTTWPNQRTTYTQFPDSSLCSIVALPPVIHAGFPRAGTPWTRSLRVVFHLIRGTHDGAPGGGVREARKEFQEDRKKSCAPSQDTSTTEPGLGDEATDCWSSAVSSPHRLVLVRLSNLTVSIDLTGADYASPSLIFDSDQLRSDLRENARCIAEVLVSQLNGQMTERHSCGAAFQKV